MIERKEKSYVHCPVCDKLLMKCFGNSEIVIRCGKCNRDIEVVVKQRMITVSEVRKGSGAETTGEVRVSVPMNQMRTKEKLNLLSTY